MTLLFRRQLSDCCIATQKRNITEWLKLSLWFTKETIYWKEYLCGRNKSWILKKYYKLYENKLSLHDTKHDIHFIYEICRKANSTVQLIKQMWRSATNM